MGQEILVQRNHLLMLSLPWTKSRKLNLRYQRKKLDSLAKIWNSKHSMISLSFCAYLKNIFTNTRTQTITVKNLFRNIENLNLKYKQNTIKLEYNTSTVIIWIPDTWIPNSMGVLYSNGKLKSLSGPFEYQTFWTINKLFSFRFSDHHLNSSPFYNQTQINHSNTRLVQYSDGYCMHFCWYSGDPNS